MARRATVTGALRTPVVAISHVQTLGLGGRSKYRFDLGRAMFHFCVTGSPGMSHDTKAGQLAD